MTLHWWMHWFWITLHLILCCSTPPVLSIAIDGLKTDRATNGSSTIPPKTLSPSNGTNNTTNPSTFVSKLNNTSSGYATTEPRKLITNSINTETSVIEPLDEFNETTGPPGNGSESNQNGSNSTLINNDECSNSTTTGPNVEERSSALDEETNRHNLSAASITGITLGVVTVVGFVVAGSVLLYRNRSFNRPQVLNDRCSNPDSSGYIDDSTIRENSEEMYSLDNDSFLNSLEAMTIPNYWTDTVKHTKL